MKRLSINFTWEKDRRPLRLGLLLLVLAVEISLWVGGQAVEGQRALETLQAERQALQPVPDPPKAALSLEDQQRQHAELKMAQGVIDRLDTPWGVLFAAVDSAFDDQVTLLNVEPDAERRDVQLTAEAKDLAAMQAYVRQIQNSPTFVDAYLASHQINQQDPLRPVRFIVHARWIPPPVSTAAKTEETGAATDTPPTPDLPKATSSVADGPSVQKAGG